jgi:hypothetical protein
MSLFSYHNGIPAPLPVELRGVDTERLASIGYSGPFLRHRLILARIKRNGQAANG